MIYSLEDIAASDTTTVYLWGDLSVDMYGDSQAALSEAAELLKRHFHIRLLAYSPIDFTEWKDRQAASELELIVKSECSGISNVRIDEITSFANFNEVMEQEHLLRSEFPEVCV